MDANGWRAKRVRISIYRNIRYNMSTSDISIYRPSIFQYQIYRPSIFDIGYIDLRYFDLSNFRYDMLKLGILIHGDFRYNIQH